MRILICDPRPDDCDEIVLAASLGRLGHLVEVTSDGSSFLEAAVANRPDLVVYALRPQFEDDVAVLRLLRRVQPEIGIIILAGDTSLSTRSAFQPFQPIYYAVTPTEPSEMIEAVQAGLRRLARTG